MREALFTPLLAQIHPQVGCVGDCKINVDYGIGSRRQPCQGLCWEGGRGPCARPHVLPVLTPGTFPTPALLSLSGPSPAWAGPPRLSLPLLGGPSWPASPALGPPAPQPHLCGLEHQGPAHRVMSSVRLLAALPSRNHRPAPQARRLRPVRGGWTVQPRLWVWLPPRGPVCMEERFPSLKFRMKKKSKLPLPWCPAHLVLVSCLVLCSLAAWVLVLSF